MAKTARVRHLLRHHGAQLVGVLLVRLSRFTYDFSYLTHS